MAEPTGIDPLMQEELVEPFTAAICEVLRNAAGIDAAAAGCARTKTGNRTHDMAIFLPLKSDRLESLVLSTPASSASELARRMLPDVADHDDTLIRDCLGEIANITAGQAKALLHGSLFHFVFSTPLALSGKERELVPERGECLALDFQSEVGPFTLQLWIKPGFFG